MAADGELPYLMRRQFKTVEFAQREPHMKAVMEIDEPRAANGSGMFCVPLRCDFVADHGTDKDRRLTTSDPVGEDKDLGRLEFFLGSTPELSAEGVYRVDAGSVLGLLQRALTEKLPQGVDIRLHSPIRQGDGAIKANILAQAVHTASLPCELNIDLSAVAVSDWPALDRLKEIVSSAATEVQYQVDAAMPSTVSFTKFAAKAGTGGTASSRGGVTTDPRTPRGGGDGNAAG